MSLKFEYEQRRETPSDINEHLHLMWIIAKNIPNVKVLELGVRTGNSTSAFLYAALIADGHVFSVDINEPEVPACFWQSQHWQMMIDDDTDSDTVEFVSAYAPFDILFIDTSHYLDHTLFELRTYGAMVKKGGVILCHDTEWEDKEVAKALDIYCAELGISWYGYKNNNGLGIVTL